MASGNLPAGIYANVTIEELQADGLEGVVAPNDLFDQKYAEHASAL